MVGVKEGKVVATHGDMQHEVNRGLNCVKGYFLSKIMYGEDRLTTPLMRKRNGRFDKEGEFEPVSWDEAFDVMADRVKQQLAEKGPESIGMFGSGQWTVMEGYAASKLMRAGFRSNNLDPNARHCMASAAIDNTCLSALGASSRSVSPSGDAAAPVLATSAPMTTPALAASRRGTCFF